MSLMTKQQWHNHFTFSMGLAIQDHNFMTEYRPPTPLQRLKNKLNSDLKEINTLIDLHADRLSLSCDINHYVRMRLKRDDFKNQSA